MALWLRAFTAAVLEDQNSDPRTPKGHIFCPP